MSSRQQLPALFTAALSHHQAGRLDQAEQLYRRVLEQDRRHADATHYLGLLASQTQRYELAVQMMRRALMLEPSRAHYYSNLSEALRRAGDVDGAIEVASRGLQLQGGSADCAYALGLALHAARQFSQAAQLYLRTIDTHPKHSGAYSNLGSALRQLGKIKDALETFERGAARAGESAELLGNWAYTLLLSGRPREALEKSRRAVQLNDQDAVAHGNLARCLCSWLEPQQAISHYHRALQLRPDFSVVHSNLLFFLIHQPSVSGEDLLHAHAEWGRRHAPTVADVPPYANERDAHRRLRVGYVSPDFREHPVAFFVEPLLQHHGEAVEVFCYSTSATAGSEGSVTRRLKSYGHCWREVAELPDAKLAQLIRDDQIDVLVDLAGHTAEHRLQVFAWRPAPIQATYLGYQATTGVPAIHYRFTDALVDPPGVTDSFHTEKLVRLELFACYRPPDECPEISPPPCLAQGGFTFGAYSKVEKISEPTLDLWAKVLHEVRDSRLLVFATAFDEPAIAQRLKALLDSRGIDPARVEAMGSQSLPDYLASHARVDLLLDTFSFNAHTTTCHALWMGVPTVTLAGSRYASRMGLAVMKHIGLDEFVATSEQQFIETAAAMAQQPQKLADLRATMRPRMSQSILMDARRFTAGLEAAYQELWRQWCAAR